MVVIHHDDQTRIISLQGDFDHVLISRDRHAEASW